MVRALLFRHRLDDCLLAFHSAEVNLALVDFSRKSRNHLHEGGNRAHLPDSLELVEHIVEGEFAAGHLLFEALRLLDVDSLLRFFDKRDDVAHSENPACDSLRMERLEILSLLARADKKNRLVRYRLERKRRTAPRVGIEFREDYASKPELLVKAFRDVDGILAGHRVRDENRLDRGNSLLHIDELSHHRLVNLEASGRIDNHRVVSVLLRERKSALRHLHGIFLAVLKVHGNVYLLAELAELLHGCRANEVAGDEKRATAVFDKAGGELMSRGRFSRTLKAEKKDDRLRIRLLQLQIDLRVAEHLHDSVVDYLDELLPRVNGAEDFLALRLLDCRVHEPAHDAKVYVSLKERHLYLLDGFLDIFLSYCGLSADSPHDVAESVRYFLKHYSNSAKFSLPVSKVPEGNPSVLFPC